MTLAAITRYAQKGAPGEKLTEAELVAGLGLPGDFHQGGERQLSLLSVSDDPDALVVTMVDDKLKIRTIDDYLPAEARWVQAFKR